jgi:two-component system cell cycle sensor histidine kinase/response regulator CckA
MSISVETRQAEPTTTDERQRVDLALLRELFDREPLALVGGSLAALAVVLVLWDSVSQARLIIWSACVLVTGLVRYVQLRRYRRTTVTSDTAPRWRRAFVALTALVGVHWGAVGLLLFPVGSPEQQHFVVLVVGLLVASSVVALSLEMRAFLAFALPATIPLLFRFVTGNGLDLVTAVVWSLLVVLAVLAAARANKTTRSSIRLGLQRESLASYLQVENERVDELNRRLTAEVAERRSIEAELRAHRERLEGLVKTTTNDLTATNGALGEAAVGRKQAVKRQLTAESNYRVLVEQSLEGVCVIRNGKFVYVNPGMTETCGFSRDELLALPSVYEHVIEDDREMVAAWVREALGSPGQRMSAAMRVRRRDGAVHDLEVRGSRIEYEGEAALLASLRDVTQRKRLQQRALEIQTLESAGHLAGGVAHNFNNALTAIYGRCRQLLKQMGEEDPRRAAVEAIFSVAERSAKMTRQLLAFGRRQELTPELFDPSLAVRRVDQVARSLLGEHIRMELRIDREVGMVWGDPGQIEQAIMNLVLNARDALIAQGTLIVDVTNVELDHEFSLRYPRLTPGPYVRITVSDSGIGMNAETRSRVFEPFFTTKEPERGSGLGLATTPGVVTQSGGDISVQSEPDRGSTFTVYLPRVNGVSAATGQEERDKTARARGGAETILCVEDESDVRDVVCEILRDFGYDVIEAADGPSAVCAAEAHTGRIHLLLTDVVMPGMSGYSVAASLVRARHDLRVLYMTGYSGTPAERPASTLDAPMLQKPFEPNQLAELVRDILDSVVHTNHGAPLAPSTSADGSS